MSYDCGPVGGITGGCGTGGFDWYSTGTILVLFILLVIISKIFFC
ncbi:hypothetical protein [Paenibacillus sp. Marseille-Q4541]|nr:hypothetical protein [Paenibacillus sp. Marseille-Q4541]